MSPVERRRWPSQPGRYRWIVDGHNTIFAHPALEALQTGDQKAEARRRLQQMLERFAARYRLQILVVFDGNRMERNPDVYRGERVTSLYALAPDEEADDRILWLSERWIADGERVVVVSSDRMTLGARLSNEVVRVEPSELFRRLAKADEGRAGGRPPGDFSDIEAHFLAAGEGAGRDEDRGRPAVPSPVEKPAPPGPRQAAPKGGTGGERGKAQPAPVARDRAALEKKQRRGQEKQRRRLARRQQGKGKRR